MNINLVTNTRYVILWVMVVRILKAIILQE